MQEQDKCDLKINQKHSVFIIDTEQKLQIKNKGDKINERGTEKIIKQQWHRGLRANYQTH